MKSGCIFAVCMAVALTSSAAVPRIQVYRNDGTFHRIELGAHSTITHNLTPVDSSLTIQSPEGSIAIPLAAIDSCTLRTTDIPLLHITLTDYPDAGQLWDKETYLKAMLTAEGNGSCHDTHDAAVSIKGRGNSTWGMPKKPYRLKFAKKTSICGFPKAKSYVLLANYIDASLMKNALALTAARMLGMPYTNTFVPCDVELNGHAQGAYMLTQKIGINSGSLDIDENTGVLLELSTEFDEDYRFRSPLYNLPVMIKDPDFADLYADNPSGPEPEERLEIWRADFTAAEAAAAAGHGFEAFDLDSFVDYLLINNFTGNDEIGWPKSVYLYKTAPGDGQRYMFGPVWDFDAAFNCHAADDQGGFAPRTPSSPLWLNALFGRLVDHPEFHEAYRRRLEHFVSAIYPELLDFADSYATQIEPSAKLNGLLWPEASAGWTYAPSSFDAEHEVAALKAWMAERVRYMQMRCAAGGI